MKRIVLTGATSMIGVALIEECIDNEIEVLAITRKNSNNIARIPESKFIKVVECNLNNIKDLNDIADSYDVFYHFAWDYTSKDKRDNARCQDYNIGYTLDAVELAKKLNCNTFIGAGSQAEYGIASDIISPSTPINPESAYGAAKYAAGKLSGLMCRDLEIRHIWTRIFSVYGRYDNEGTMVRYAIEELLKGKKPSFTKSEQKWDYLYSKDAGRAFYLIGQFGIDKSIYCLGSGKVRTLSDYINIINQMVNPNMPVGIGDKDYVNNQVMHLCADISSLTRDTGFQPKYQFEEGIAETIQWLKETWK
jgi:nucleoside-diphosphate-sugar epimerase